MSDRPKDWQGFIRLHGDRMTEQPDESMRWQPSRLGDIAKGSRIRIIREEGTDLVVVVDDVDDSDRSTLKLAVHTEEPRGYITEQDIAHDAGFAEREADDRG